MSALDYIVRRQGERGGWMVGRRDSAAHKEGPYAERSVAEMRADTLNREAALARHRSVTPLMDAAETRRLYGAGAPDGGLDEREREARVLLDEAAARALRAVALMGERYDTELAELHARIATLEGAANHPSEGQHACDF